MTEHSGESARPRRSKWFWVGILVPVAIVVLSASSWIVGYLSNTDGIQVGDCYAITTFGDVDADPAKADCGSIEANAKAGAKTDAGGACPAGEYDQLVVDKTFASYKLCMMINAKQGDCLENFLADSVAYQKVSCSDPTKDAEVVKVVDSVATCDDTEATHLKSYSTPPSTVCVKSAK
ncbi:LppU/SCO3897 family protein [Amycolatopsis azurea]|uniref:Secreted protein n=1 Tax=Amycolatopsis azurea DSM 43854 TaxID=1238180 RepID=A0ABX3JAA0_9PSEU|nr:hypothetical protein [Amycolatopsis azurea]OOC03829.1 hypothetical protein B0293_26585 [Amycolatopsis azurea DSM 43854]